MKKLKNKKERFTKFNPAGFLNNAEEVDEFLEACRKDGPKTFEIAKRHIKKSKYSNMVK